MDWLLKCELVVECGYNVDLAAVVEEALASAELIISR